MERIILLKYGEMVLKGLNKGYFTLMLERRIKQLLKPVTPSDGSFELEYLQSTLYIRAHGSADIDEALVRVKKVFGIASICLSYETEKDMDSIRSAVRENAAALTRNAATFKCDARRSDKAFPLTSPQICEDAGAVILETIPGIRVDVHNPGVTVTVEIRDKKAYIHSDPIKGAGGMPNGSNGRAMLLLSGGIDSPVAGYLAAKRGVALDCVYFESPPYTSELAREKVVTLAKKLYPYCGTMYLHCVPTTEIQELIRDKCEEKLGTLLLRRFMMRMAEKIAVHVGADALVTGESIGQVASQTLLSISVTNAAASLPVLRPCITLDKEEIVVKAREIGTFETSILPYEDCCSVFTPKHPNTRPTLDLLLAEEAKLDIEALEKAAVEARTVIKIVSEE